MLSIQIDTISLELVIYVPSVQQHQIVLLCKPYMKSSFPLCTFNRCCTVVRYSRVLFFKFLTIDWRKPAESVKVIQAQKSPSFETISYLHYFHSFIMPRRIKLKWSYTK